MVGLLLGELVEGEFASGQSQNGLAGAGILQESGGILRSPEESGGNTGIPVLPEFLQKNPVKVT